MAAGAGTTAQPALCNPMDDGCKALEKAKGDLKSDIYTHMNDQLEKRDVAMKEIVEKVDKRLASQNARLWSILALLLANVAGLAFFLLRTIGQ